MKYATRIKMKTGCGNSFNCLEIDSIYLEGFSNDGFYKKEAVHDYLQNNPSSIRVKLGAQPFLIPATSVRGEKYVKSKANDSPDDNLLQLPRS